MEHDFTQAFKPPVGCYLADQSGAVPADSGAWRELGEKAAIPVTATQNTIHAPLELSTLRTEREALRIIMYILYNLVIDGTYSQDLLAYATIKRAWAARFTLIDMEGQKLAPDVVLFDNELNISHDERSDSYSLDFMQGSSLIQVLTRWNRLAYLSTLLDPMVSPVDVGFIDNAMTSVLAVDSAPAPSVDSAPSPPVMSPDTPQPAHVNISCDMSTLAVQVGKTTPTLLHLLLKKLFSFVAAKPRRTSISVIGVRLHTTRSLERVACIFILVVTIRSYIPQ